MLPCVPQQSLATCPLLGSHPPRQARGLWAVPVLDMVRTLYNGFKV